MSLMDQLIRGASEGRTAEDFQLAARDLMYIEAGEQGRFIHTFGLDDWCEETHDNVRTVIRGPEDGL